MGRTQAYAQLRDLFLAEVTGTTEKKVCLLCRWAELQNKRQWDSTKQPLLKWAAVPEESMKLSGMGDAYYQLLELEAVLESVTVVPKPAAKSQEDKGDIDDREREMWIHTIGYSSFGEAA